MYIYIYIRLVLLYIFHIYTILHTHPILHLCCIGNLYSASMLYPLLSDHTEGTPK